MSKLDAQFNKYYKFNCHVKKVKFSKLYIYIYIYIYYNDNYAFSPNSMGTFSLKYHTCVYLTELLKTVDFNFNKT